MLSEPEQYFIFVIEDAFDETKPKRYTNNEEVAETEYNSGNVVTINEIIDSYLSTRQKVRTVITTNWTETRGIYGY